MPKQIITFRQEEMLSYFVGLAPIGQEVTIDMKIIRDDLGYTTTRGVYAATRRLRDVGAVTLHGRARSWQRTTWSCHRRPEEFRVIPSPARTANRRAA